MLSADFTNKEVMIMDRKYIKLLIISFVFMVICLGRNNALNVYAVELPVIPIGEESSESNDNSNKEDTQLPIVEENEESSGQKDTTENKKDDSKKQENGKTEEKSGTNKKTDKDNTLPVMAPDGDKPIMGVEVTINENAEKSSAGQESEKEVSETENKQSQSDRLEKDNGQAENTETEDSTAGSSIHLAVWIIAGLVVLGIAGVVFWRKKR